MDRRTFAHATLLRYQAEIVQMMQDLVRIPSQNTPPFGAEGRCQQTIADHLSRAGLPVELYEPDRVPGLPEHPLYWPGRDYRGRPNLTSRLRGRGGGRSLLLTGHCDTVPVGEERWSRDPFGAAIADGRLYGLGSLDMKGPLAALLVLYKAVAELGLPLRGDLVFESVVDEEYAGVNATLAGRLRDGPLDGAVIVEGTDLAIYPAARGLLLSTLTFRSADGSYLHAGGAGEDKRAAGAAQQPAGVIEQIGLVLDHLDELQARRRAHLVHPLYRSYPEPAPVQVTKIYAGGWGFQVPITLPAEGRMELILQALPGEERAAVVDELQAWLDGVVARRRTAFDVPPEIDYHLRWMPPAAMDPSHPLVTTLAAAAVEIGGEPPNILGVPYACDLFALQQISGMPALVFGPRGANAHAADEYVDIASVFTFWETLLLFVLDWCGAQAA